jgi:hypothetical protein
VLTELRETGPGTNLVVADKAIKDRKEIKRLSLVRVLIVKDAHTVVGCHHETMPLSNLGHCKTGER